MVKNLPANTRDLGLIPGLGRYPGEGNGNLLQCPWLEIPWTEDPGRLQVHSVPKRVGRDLEIKNENSAYKVEELRKNNKRILGFCSLPFVVLIQAQEKDKLYIDLICHLEVTIVEFPGDFSEINHSTLAQKDLLGASQSFTSIGSLVSGQLWSSRTKLACCSAIWGAAVWIRETQNQYCVQLELWMEHNYHTSLDIGPGYWFVMLPLLWKSKTFNCRKELIFHDSSKDCTTWLSWECICPACSPYVFVVLCRPLTAWWVFVCNDEERLLCTGCFGA